jgi:hypothetical protein
MDGHLSCLVAWANPDDPNLEDALKILDMAEIEDMASIKAEKIRLSSLP